MPWAQIIALIAAQYLNYRAQQDAADEQQRILTLADEESSRIGDKSLQKTLDQAQNYATDARLQRQGRLTTDLQKAYLEPVTQQAALAPAPGSDTNGKVSNDFLTAKAQAQRQNLQDAHDLASALSKANSANRLRLDEAIQFGRSAEEVAGLKDQQLGIGNVAKAQAAGVRPDAALTIGSQLLRAYALGSMMGGKIPTTTTPGVGTTWTGGNAAQQSASYGNFA